LVLLATPVWAQGSKYPPLGESAATAATASDRDLVYDAKLRAPICFDLVASRTGLPL
jgi:hypothetical protein